MRILQIVTQTKVGGAESFALSLSGALARRGHEVRLLANRDNGPLLERTPPGVSAFACRRSSRLDLGIIPFLERHLGEFRPEIVHGHNFPANTWARALGFLHPRLRIVCHEHSGKIGKRPGRRFAIDRILNRRTSLVFAVSEEIVQVLRRARVIDPGRIHHLAVGIDVSRYGNARGDESILPEAARGRARALQVASLIPVKNHRLVLEAFAPVAASTDAVLLLAGDGPLRGEIEERIARPDLRGRVILLGLRSDVAELLSLSTAFVLSSSAEGMPLSLLEAMAAGVCPIVPAVGAIPSLVTDGESGFLFTADQQAGLSAALQRALADPAAAQALGAHGRARVAERYSIDAIAAQVEEHYRKIRR
ncbi:MAG: glycosyltransferase family 4 protein [Candidatus Eisenbacteria bacterium]|nr:glycosyltransferase family 4 protein [Candidatus Eisenbacteria bacterium]